MSPVLTFLCGSEPVSSGPLGRTKERTARPRQMLAAGKHSLAVTSCGQSRAGLLPGLPSVISHEAQVSSQSSSRFQLGVESRAQLAAAPDFEPRVAESQVRYHFGAARSR